MQRPTSPDTRLVAIARDDDYAFGVLHSRVYEEWPLNTPEDALTSAQRGHRDAIGAAAAALDAARGRWLNPPEWVRAEPDVIASLPPRLVPVDEAAAQELAKRTLTNLYNARPAWLEHLHRDLDAAVFAAYGWPEAPDGAAALDDETMLARLLALNLARAAAP